MKIPQAEVTKALHTVVQVPMSSLNINMKNIKAVYKFVFYIHWFGWEYFWETTDLYIYTFSTSAG